MPGKRNIADFFLSFVQKKADPAHADDDVLENIDVAVQDKPVSPHEEVAPTIGGSLRQSTVVSEQDVESFAPPTLSGTSTAPSSSNPPMPHVRDGSRRIMRQLSPLSSRSSKSPSPQPSLHGQASPSLPPRQTSTSFLSTSSLSALPVSSQSSSRRIVRDGQFAVTNSDSDSVDHDDDPLDEIEELVRRKRLRMTPDISHTSITLDSTSDGRNLRSSRRKHQTSSTARQTSSPPRKKYRFDLANLAKQSRAEAEWSEKQREYEEQSLDTIEEENQRQAQVSGLDRITDQLRGEEGDAQDKEQLLRAMKRMDALQEDVQYSFFRRTDTDVPRPKFPISSLKGHVKWATIMKGQASRKQAFMTGFISDMVCVLPLPDEIIEWILQDLLYETQDHLSLAYISTIEVCSTIAPVSLEPMRERLLKFSGREDFSSGAVTVAPALLGVHDSMQCSDILCAVKRCSLLVGKVAATLPISEQRNWLQLLMLILLDRAVQGDIMTKSEVQHALVALMDAIAPDRFDATIKGLGINTLKAANNPILLHRLLYSLPSTSSTMHTFKRRLALSFILKDEGYLTDDLDRLSITSSITSHLRKSAKFKVREDTDFAAMGARIGILDVAIGAGFSDFGFFPDEESEKADTPVTGSGEGIRRRPLSEAERAFNESVDSLVSELRLIASNIRDAGAAHMQRTECKGILEKLSYRLDYAARTRPKAKRSIFGAGGGASAVLQSYLTRKEEELQHEAGASSDDG